MNRALLSAVIVLFVMMVSSPSARAADMESPQFAAANALYVNAKHALLSTTLLGIQAFANRAMDAARRLQAEALAAGDDTLVHFAQGAYNNSKRALMSQTIEQARDYSEQAVSFAQKARHLLAASVDTDTDRSSRRNLNNDQPDTAFETYYQLRPEAETSRQSRYEYR
jgi:hypothetical protein